MNDDTTERGRLESMLWGRFSFSQDDCGAIAAAVLAKGFRRQPQEVTDAMVEAACIARVNQDGSDSWTRMHEDCREMERRLMRPALEAALRAAGGGK